MIAKCLS
jgi:hypothetical protein